MTEPTQQDPHTHPENPPAVTIEWPEGAETYIAASPIVDVAQSLLGACKTMIEALARHAGADDFSQEDARALEVGRAAIAQVERSAAASGT
jgi:hypothetical protein